jgi:hypothetical protein
MEWMTFEALLERPMLLFPIAWLVRRSEADEISRQ